MPALQLFRRDSLSCQAYNYQEESAVGLCGPSVRPFLIMSDEMGMPGYSVSFCFWHLVFRPSTLNLHPLAWCI